MHTLFEERKGRESLNRADLDTRALMRALFF